MTYAVPSDIPRGPGIYMMKDSDGAVIYVGKAKNLRNRVRSYFNKSVDRKTSALVEKISDIEFVLTDNESEAFVLEANMIKRYRPRYNIELKDQERYTYLRLSDERYPRLLVARRTRTGRFLGKGRTFGPFTQGSSKLLTIGTLRKAFKIRICKTLPKKVCLEYHLGNCEGPCEFQSARDEYGRHVERLEGVLGNKNQMQAFARVLQRDMRRASDMRNFERAIEIRDTLKRLDVLHETQKMDRPHGSDEEYFAISTQRGMATVMTFKMINGVIRDSDRFSFDVMADNNFGNFLYQYYTTRAVPNLILANQKPDNLPALSRALAERAGHSVSLTVPKRGRRRQMIDLLARNIKVIEEAGADPHAAELGRHLGCAPPSTIECFDVSNHGSDFAVGAMSRLVDGVADKSGYRRFKIKTVRGRDDYAMMSEIVSRRYAKAEPPDLVLIDGGRGHLSSAVRALKGVGAEAFCASIAKENEEVFLVGRPAPVTIPKDSGALKILQRARDEAHRFGVKYNRHLARSKMKK